MRGIFFTIAAILIAVWLIGLVLKIAGDIIYLALVLGIIALILGVVKIKSN
ncbi:DUF5670 family protein [Olivibacter sitiensis]|uniref:DUF5670 family protein n=1 Tax=Olivibacter sitiensis TaxID=376470 RepID=UPI0004253C3A|nr:DUF5670 family protein [Olivibacter sitiensis]